ncbi:MAG: hypothetical protein KatS3mg027_0445 [Bacteroidia bacterium]|nr:MAG: hypothetical protein KatS3mg027_0445 [Bacteroidia bacterium]
MLIRFAIVVGVFFSLNAAYAQLDNIIKKAENVYEKNKDAVEQTIDKYTGNKPKLTESEIIQGLKEALSVGTQSAVSISSKTDGFLKNPRLFIPFPPEAQEMKDKLVKYGFSKKVEEFETSLNRSAEYAAKEATPIFLNAIKQMSVKDAMGILKGSDTAATHYLRQTTYDSLFQKFLPVVKNSIQQVQVTKYWKPLVTTYNKLPNKKKYNPDLEKYVTHKAIQGLFVLIADEEKNIRQNPAARINDILKKVFGEN